MEGRQTALLVLFCAVYVAWGLTDSIQAPFYPIEAESKGATIAEYGFVFGVIHLAIFISGPIFGKYMTVLGLKNVYIFGVVSTGVCALLFGFLDFVNDKVAFLAYSYTLRILEGVAEAASWSAVFAMLLQMFPNNVATVYSFTEASFSFSEMVGPTLGALLYSVGGFALPFELCGVLCLVTGLVTILVLPNEPGATREERQPLKSITENTEQEEIEEEEENERRSDGLESLLIVNGNSVLTGNPASIRRASSVRSGSSTRRSRQGRNQQGQAQIWPVLKNLDVILALSGTVFAASVQGLLEACLEHYLERFDLTITRIGLTFLALSVPYFLASPMWGYACDHLVAPEYVQAAGNTLICCGLAVIAPVPYLPWASNYSITCFGLTFLGIGTAAGLVASFSGAQRAALRDSAPGTDPNEVYPAISGIWTSSFALGNFLGPSAGGFLFAQFGFAKTTLAFQCAGFTSLCIDIVKIVRLHRAKSNRRKRGINLYERL